MKKRIFCIALILAMLLTVLPVGFGSAVAETASVARASVSITTQPKSATVAVGKTVTMKIVASGAKTYQWQYSKNNGASWTNWSGKTSASVSLTGSATNNGCLYRCVAKNGTASATSKNARLTVSGVKPMILTQPKSATVALGSEATFKVVAGGTGKTYQWQYSKDNGKTWTTWTGRTESSITVTSSKTNHGCRYRCIVKNSKGSVTSSAATLLMKGAPAITTHPSAMTAGAGLKATFKVAASGSGLSYQWQYSKDNGKTWENCSSTGYNKATFSFTTNGGLDGRLYRCVVKNSKGSMTSSYAKLTVPQYRALMIGEQNYPDYYDDTAIDELYGTVNDAKAMQSMLKGLRQTFNTKLLTNVSKSTILSTISSYFKSAKSYDVSLFYYSGHGTKSWDYDSDNHGALCPIKTTTIDGVKHYETEYLSTAELATALSKVKGKVIVLLDSCFSGNVIRKDANGNPADDLDAYNQEIINAFSGYELEGDAKSEIEGASRYGELRQSKFIVLTAAAYDQESSSLYYYSSGSEHAFGLFTRGLLEGLGMNFYDSSNNFKYPTGKYSGSMPADKNSNKTITLSELYNYITSYVSDMGGSQTTMYYGNGNTVLFKR